MKEEKKINKVYDFSKYHSIEDISDISILRTQLLNTLKETIVEPYSKIYIVGSFCFNVGKSNDIDVLYCTPKQYKRIGRKTVIYSKELSTILNKKIHLIIRHEAKFIPFQKTIHNPPYFDLLNLKFINKNYGDKFNKKLYKKKWVTRFENLE